MPVGLVFLAAVASKVARPVPTLRVIAALSGGYETWVNAGFLCLIAAETLLGCWLLIGVARRLALATAVAFLVLFSAVPLALLFSGSELACGCGMPVLFSTPQIEQIIALCRNVLLLFAVVAAWTTTQSSA